MIDEERKRVPGDGWKREFQCPFIMIENQKEG